MKETTQIITNIISSHLPLLGDQHLLFSPTIMSQYQHGPSRRQCIGELFHSKRKKKKKRIRIAIIIHLIHHSIQINHNQKDNSKKINHTNHHKYHFFPLTSLGRSTFAFFSNNNVTISTWPISQAMNRGVVPL